MGWWVYFKDLSTGKRNHLVADGDLVQRPGLTLFGMLWFLMNAHHLYTHSHIIHIHIVIFFMCIYIYIDIYPISIHSTVVSLGIHHVHRNYRNWISTANRINRTLLPHPTSPPNDPTLHKLPKTSILDNQIYIYVDVCPCPSIYCIYLSIHVSICLPVCWFVYLSINLSICLSCLWISI